MEQLRGVASDRQVKEVTFSVCPVCLAPVEARIVEEAGKVYMEKVCEEHGHFKALVWNDSEMYSSYAGMFDLGEPSELKNACPLECGLCTGHAEGTCVAIVEVTNRCNLRCAVCFASSDDITREEPTLGQIADEFETIIENGGAGRPVQLSGGEPTTREDLAQIVRRAREMGLSHIEVNTNGVRLGEDPGLARLLSEAGVSAIYLQFDGLDDGVYLTLRGRKLLDVKMKALDNCRANGLAVVLVPTVVKGVNDGQLGAIIDLAARREEIKGVNFQPATYFGRFPEDRRSPEDRTTIPDVVAAIERQTGGALAARDFFPIPSLHHSCSAVTLALARDDGLMPLSRVVDPIEVVGKLKDPHCTVTKAIPRLWDVSNERETFGRLRDYLKKLGLEVEGGDSTKILSISMMAFQDAWTLDTERMRRCRVHVIRPGGQLVPFCAYYLTGADGRRIY
ncbi:MAG TPA: radical SAM protein [Conexivisphaerales archaeon]|nr:radical SAM protein [Conexivisphaerales archaeon]